MSIYEFGPFQLDAERLLLLDSDAPIPLGPKVVETLLALIEHPGELIGKNDLLARIWPEGYVDEANLAQNVYVLRKTLRARWNAEAIETIPRRGYRFTAPVRRRECAERPVPALAPRAPTWIQRHGFVLAAAFAVALLGGSALTASPSSGAHNGSVEGTRLYAMGRYYWNLRTREGIAKSIDYFARVVELDPHDARGYAGLASANAIEADYGYGALPAKIYIGRARTYASKALALDPRSGEAYAVLGLISSEVMKGAAPQNDRALRDLRHAIALDTSSGSAHEWYGMALLQQGRVSEAYSELRLAAQLEPLSVATTAWLGTTAYLERHYSEAIGYARETLDLSPQRDDAYETLGLAYEALGDVPRAAETFRRLGQACSPCRAQSAALLAALYARNDQMPRARAALAIAAARPADVAPQDLAAAFEAVGEREAALTWLKRWRTNSYYATELANDPRFAALRHSAGSKQQKPA